jgi:hypothetical protein
MKEALEVDILIEKYRYTQERITSMIINNITAEEVVANDLYRKYITEADYYTMRGRLGIDEPTFIKIGNYLRDNWRKAIEHTNRKF